MLKLAFKFIRYDRAKSIGIITAIVISVFLIGQQLGLLFYLMGLMGNLVGNAPEDDHALWVMERQSNNINAVNNIDTRLVQQIGSLSSVRHATGVVLAPARASFLDGKTASVTLVGAEAPGFVMGPTNDKIFEGDRTSIMEPNAVSAEFYSGKTWNTTVAVNKPIEINGTAARISLVTKNAQAFGASLMYTSITNARALANMPANKVSIVIATLKEGADKETAMQDINQLFPHLKAWDPTALKKSTVKEILITSNMGTSFGTLVLFAMISGFFIIGLTLYSSALDRIKDYGTLKAIGATSFYVNRLIIAQAFLYGIIGYIIAILLLFLFKISVVNAGLVIDISIPFCIFLLVITLSISVGGSLFAVRKINKLEPASVF